MKKRLLALLLTILMLFGMLPVTVYADVDGQAYDFVDMPNNWSTAALKKAVDNGLLKGYEVGGKTLINGDAPLKRAEMAAVVNRAFGAVKTSKLNGVTDVPSTSWYASDMAKAVMMGIFMKDTTMRPEENITRQEAFVVLARAFKISSEKLDFEALQNYSDKSDIAAWAKKELNAMVEAGYVKGSNGKLDPNANISRAEFATVMDNLVKQYIDMPGEVTDVLSGNILIRVPGVTLKNLTVKGDLFIADGVGEGDLTLDNVKVEGRTVVRGGGENSIVIKSNSNLGKIIVCKTDGNVRIAVEGSADVKVIYVDDGSDDVLVEGVIGTLEVAGDNITAIATKAFLNNAIISGDNSTIILRAKSSMKEGTITGNASKIIVDKGATADKIIIVGSDAKVEGNGTVKNVEVKASGDYSSITTPNTKIETEKGAEGVTAAGDAPVKGGTTATNNSAGTWIVTSSSSSSGGASTGTVSAINIATTPDVTGGVNNDAVVEITLSTATSGPDIYYTTDGSTPTASSTKYSAPFVVEAGNAEGKTIIVKAIGVMAGYTNSAIAVKEIVFKPASIYVTAIRVSSNPAKITYYEGESLELAGLRVELSYSNNSSEYVELADFATKGITADPVNGTILTIAEHNDKRIVVSCNDKSAQSGDMLKVMEAIPSEFAGGDGSEENPYHVATAEQLDNVRNYLDKHFKQTADIDLADYLSSGGAGYNEGKGWEPIGVFVSGDTGNPFTGSYNGNNKTISNLNINRPDKDFVGLFEYSRGDINNLTLLGVDISGKGTVGGLVGYQRDGKITDCSVSGSVNGTGSRVGGLIGSSYEVGEVIGSYSTASVEGFNDVGGLIGRNDYSKIEKCYATGNVKGNSSTTGGLVASNYNGVIKNCYSTGSVYGLYDEVGGLVGWNTYSGAQIINSYATGQVTGGGERIGGLVGRNQGSAIVDKCYAIGKVIGGAKVGGLIGETIEGATTTNSYWDINTSGQATSAGGTGYPTSAMIMSTNSVPIYVDWDFADTWAIDTNLDSYPYLKWQGNENIPYPPFAGGDGTVDDPYQVATASQLNNVRNHLDAHFVQTADINLGVAPWNEAEGWMPIGSESTPFKGKFNGDGYTISGLKINRPTINNVGLFSSTLGAMLDDITLKNVDVTGYLCVGGLVGYNKKDSVIKNSSSSGTVFGMFHTIGGLTGYNHEGTIENSFSAGTVTASYGTVGGLVGRLYNAIVKNSYSIANVVNLEHYDTGGLVGSIESDSLVLDCYAMGSVNGKEEVGGFAGRIINDNGSVAYCYATGRVEGTSDAGGMVGKYYNGNVYYCYWDTLTSIQETSAHGMGRTTAEMQTQSTFADWDFDTIWGINPDENEGYPFLRWQGYEHINVKTTEPLSVTATKADKAPTGLSGFPTESYLSNQDKVTVEQTGNTVVVSGPLASFESYAQPGQGVSHKYIVLFVDTGEESILGMSYDGAGFTYDPDMIYYSKFGVDTGTFIQWIKAEEVVNTPMSFTLSKEGKDDTKITISFTDIP